VVDDLEESFVAAVSRMVLVGRGGLRLHEEVFLAGVRTKGRRAMAEEKAEAALDKALDGETLTLADPQVRYQLCDLWNVPDAPLRLRLEESMQARAARRHEVVIDQLTRRQDADIQRAREIAAIADRYADVKPHTTAAAVVFALTKADAFGWID